VTRQGGGQLAVTQADPGPAPAAGLAAITAEFRAAARTGQINQAARDQACAGSYTAPSGRPGPDDVWPLYMPPQQVSAAATIDPVDWGPTTGRAWRIEQVVVTFQGASSVTFYRQAAQLSTLLFVVSQPGVWEPRKLVLVNGARLVAVVAGGGATISCIEGDDIGLHALPWYLI
jgi:hypothetical protein